jgi:hypothetical protein
MRCCACACVLMFLVCFCSIIVFLNNVVFFCAVGDDDPKALTTYSDLVSDKLSALSYCYHNLAVEMEFLGNGELCLPFYEKAFRIAVGNGQNYHGQRTRTTTPTSSGEEEDGVSAEVHNLQASYMSALQKYHPMRFQKEALSVRESVRQMQKRRKLVQEPMAAKEAVAATRYISKSEEAFSETEPGFVVFSRDKGATATAQHAKNREQSGKVKC